MNAIGRTEGLKSRFEKADAKGYSTVQLLSLSLTPRRLKQRALQRFEAANEWIEFDACPRSTQMLFQTSNSQNPLDL